MSLSALFRIVNEIGFKDKNLEYLYSKRVGYLCGSNMFNKVNAHDGDTN
ncbi:MAG: hypothetical protein ACI815_001523 [Psychroserpens sp.]|jgi:hypothetical protein